VASVLVGRDLPMSSQFDPVVALLAFPPSPSDARGADKSQDCTTTLALTFSALEARSVLEARESQLFGVYVLVSGMSAGWRRLLDGLCMCVYVCVCVHEYLQNFCLLCRY